MRDMRNNVEVRCHRVKGKSLKSLGKSGFIPTYGEKVSEGVWRGKILYLYAKYEKLVVYIKNPYARPAPLYMGYSGAWKPECAF